MIEYSTYPANFTLQRFIRLYIILRTPGETLNTLRRAKLYSALLLKFGKMPEAIPGSYVFPHQLNKKFIFYNHQSWLCERQNEGSFFQNTEKSHVLCVVLTPIGVHHLFRDSSTKKPKQDFSFENLCLDEQFEGLTEKMQSVYVYNEAIQLVESHLFNYFSHLDIPLSNKDMTPVVDYILAQNGVIKIKDLEDKFHLSGRWLEKQFAEQVGMSPKDFARVTRFNALITEVKMTPSVSWSDLTDNYGYYDQSHLIRDFHDFTKQSPTEFFKNASTLRVNISV